MAYVDILDNFQSVLNTALGTYSDTTTMGNSKQYERVEDLAIADGDTAKVLIILSKAHPHPKRFGYGRNFMLYVEGTTSENLENVTLKIEQLVAEDYTQANSSDPYKIEGKIIDSMYFDGIATYYHVMSMTAWWFW